MRAGYTLDVVTTAVHRNEVEIGVLLAGGSGRRAGVDKRLLVLEGSTLLQRNLGFLRGLFPMVAVVVGRGQDLDLGDTGGALVLQDDEPGGSPMAGIATALRHFDAPVFVLAADIAFPARGAAEAVLAAFPGHDVALPTIEPDYRQPLFAVYGPGCLAPMRALLDAGRHRIAHILPEVRVAPVPFADDTPFHNINTLDDFEAARRSAAASAVTGAAGRDPAAGPVARRPALVGIVGHDEAGVAGFVEDLVAELLKLGLRVGVVKRPEQAVEADRPAEDPRRPGRAGAEAYAVAGPGRLAFLAKLEGEPPLAEVARRSFAGFDLVVGEGLESTVPHRVEVRRAGAGLAGSRSAGEVIALVGDAPLEYAHRFAPDAAEEVARFLVARLEALRRY